jgi:hypothetical protein
VAADGSGRTMPGNARERNGSLARWHFGTPEISRSSAERRNCVCARRNARNRSCFENRGSGNARAGCQERISLGVNGHIINGRDGQLAGWPVETGEWCQGMQASARGCKARVAGWPAGRLAGWPVAAGVGCQPVQAHAREGPGSLWPVGRKRASLGLGFRPSQRRFLPTTVACGGTVCAPVQCNLFTPWCDWTCGKPIHCTVRDLAIHPPS